MLSIADKLLHPNFQESPSSKGPVMLATTLHTKWLTRLFVLTYLLLSISPANASFWCHGAQSASHLDTNPIGQCWTPCDQEDDAPQQRGEATQAEVFLSAAGDDCFDSPVCSPALTSSNRPNMPSRVVAAHFDATNLPFLSDLSSGVTRFSSLNLPAQLPTPQTLRFLRTVVLLH